MNAVTIQGFGCRGFSTFTTRDKSGQSVTPFGLRLFDPSWAAKVGGREGEPPGIAEEVPNTESTVEVRSTRWLEPAGIAESVREVAVDSSAFLSICLRQRINELASLQENWDGEGAKAVKPHVLADVVETLRRLSRQPVFREPFLAPTFDGFVQMEWHDEKRWLDVEATVKGWSAVGTAIGSDGNRYYYTADFERSDFAQLERFYHWLLSDGLLTWPSL